MKTTLIIFIAANVLSFGQTTTKKATPPSARPDTWQKSKECAGQAEKMMADWQRQTGRAPTDFDWRNHYSPKYDRCFVWLYVISFSKDEKVFPTLFSTTLFDAFERSRLATACTVIGHLDCVAQIAKTGREVMLESVSQKLNGRPFAEASSDEQEAVRTTTDRILRDVPGHTESYCGIDEKAVDCEQAASFISEHMKN